jgi:hypothetical protein
MNKMTEREQKLFNIVEIMKEYDKAQFIEILDSLTSNLLEQISNFNKDFNDEFGKYTEKQLEEIGDNDEKLKKHMMQLRKPALVLIVILMEHYDLLVKLHPQNIEMINSLKSASDRMTKMVNNKQGTK